MSLSWVALICAAAVRADPAPGPACSQPEVQLYPFCNLSLTFAERAANLVAQIQLEEIGPQLTARQSPAISRLGIPAFYWGTNNVHGITNAVSGGVLCLVDTGRCVTIWPSGPNLGATFNASLFRLIGQTSGIEMRALGNVQWGPSARPGGMDGLTSWGPTINLVRDPRWGRIQETTGEDPFLNGVFAREITRGLQEGEDARYMLAVSTLKHFAVYSLEDYHAPSGQHFTRENINNVASPFDLADSYFPHFEMAVRPVANGGGSAGGVMMAMNAVNGVPALANSQLINQLKQWAGENQLYITTDGINMIDSMLQPEPGGHFFCPYHAAPCSRAEGIAAAVLAGSDICDGNEYQQTLAAAIQDGNITLGDAQQRLYNSFLIRMRLGLFDYHAPNQPYLDYGSSAVNSDASRAANVLAAKESLVLLQNNGGMLPFPRGQAGATLVIGYHGNSTLALVSNYVGQICPDKTGSCFPSIVQSIAALGESVQFVQACSAAASCSTAGVAAAVAAVGATGVTRVVMTLGISQAEEGEQRDRFNITLPGDQQTLFAAVTAAAAVLRLPVAVVLVHGGALATPELKAATHVAILDAFYPGPAGGEAVASALFGLYNPGGKLPYSVYDASFQAVDFTDMNIAKLGRTYRYHQDNSSPGGPALWSFGYGLSYTTWSLALQGSMTATLTPAAPTVSFAVQITNTGAVAGDEVVQLYLTNITGLAAPEPPFVPIRQLVWFERVHVPAGGTATLPVTLSASNFQLTLSDGTRLPIDGTYGIAISRGPGTVSVDLLVALAGW